MSRLRRLRFPVKPLFSTVSLDSNIPRPPWSYNAWRDLYIRSRTDVGVYSFKKLGVLGRPLGETQSKTSNFEGQNWQHQKRAMTAVLEAVFFCFAFFVCSQFVPMFHDTFEFKSVQSKRCPPTWASTATCTDCLYLCDMCTSRAKNIFLQHQKTAFFCKHGPW